MQQLLSRSLNFLTLESGVCSSISTETFPFDPLMLLFWGCFTSNSICAWETQPGTSSVGLALTALSQTLVLGSHCKSKPSKDKWKFSVFRLFFLQSPETCACPGPPPVPSWQGNAAFWSLFQLQYFWGVYGQLSFPRELSASAPCVRSGDNFAALPCQFN